MKSDAKSHGSVSTRSYGQAHGARPVLVLLFPVFSTSAYDGRQRRIAKILAGGVSITQTCSEHELDELAEQMDLRVTVRDHPCILLGLPPHFSYTNWAFVAGDG